MRRYMQKSLLGICALAFLTSCDWLSQTEEDPTQDLFRTDGIPYDVVFSPELTGSLDTNIKKSSKLLRLAINQPSSKNALLKRVKKDQEIFTHILHQNGYFEGKVDFRVRDNVETSPPVRAPILQLKTRG